MVVVGAALARPLWGEQGRQTLPLPIRQLLTLHATQMGMRTELCTLCRHAQAFQLHGSFEVGLFGCGLVGSSRE